MIEIDVERERESERGRQMTPGKNNLPTLAISEWKTFSWATPKNYGNFGSLGEIPENMMLLKSGEDVTFVRPQNTEYS